MTQPCYPATRPDLDPKEPMSDRTNPQPVTATAPPWRLASRLNSFLAPGGLHSVADAIRAQASIPGLDAVEINLPQHLRRTLEPAIAAALAESGLRLTGVNLRFDDPAFAAGAFCHPVPATRDHAIDTARQAMEFAARHGADHVVLWMEADGAAAPFALDHDRAWQAEVEGVRRVAEHDPAIRVSIEYKPAERGGGPFVPLVRSMGETLLLAAEVGLPNVGVTLDLCHALIAGENPTAAASLALARGRLFGVHLNDGHGQRDDGLPVASVDPWRTLELLVRLRRAGYPGTLYFDTFPSADAAAAECAANVATLRRCESLLDATGIVPGAPSPSPDTVAALARRLPDLAPPSTDPSPTDA